MFSPKTPVIIKGYCGIIESYEVSNRFGAVPFFNITLRDMRDPRISIVMEDISLDEVQQNPMLGPW